VRQISSKTGLALTYYNCILITFYVSRELGSWILFLISGNPLNFAAHASTGNGENSGNVPRFLKNFMKTGPEIAISLLTTIPYGDIKKQLGRGAQTRLPSRPGLESILML
jgi:hypothetical protein